MERKKLLLTCTKLVVKVYIEHQILEQLQSWEISYNVMNVSLPTIYFDVSKYVLVVSAVGKFLPETRERFSSTCTSAQKPPVYQSSS